VTVVLFHTNHCNLDTCDGGCLYELQRLDVPIPTTDGALDHQWTKALDYAERMGRQTAQMLSDVNTAWRVATEVNAAWKAYLLQFDAETWHLLKDAYREGFDDVHYKILAERGIVEKANRSTQPIQVG
jgi:hypothetical protein